MRSARLMAGLQFRIGPCAGTDRPPHYNSWEEVASRRVPPVRTWKMTAHPFPEILTDSKTSGPGTPLESEEASGGRQPPDDVTHDLRQVNRGLTPPARRPRMEPCGE